MKKAFIFCVETVKICAAASEYIFYVPANVLLLLGVFLCFLMNMRLPLKDIIERLLLKENVQLIFFSVWLLLETCQCFLMSVRPLLKRYQ